MTRVLPLLVLASLSIACGGGAAGGTDAGVADAALSDSGAGDTAAPTATLTLTTDLPATAPAGEVLSVAVDLLLDGAGVAEADIDATVLAGGGAAAAVVTDSLGHASVAWTLGVVPVDQRLRLSSPELSVDLEVEVRAARDAPLASEPFGDVAGFLAAAGIDASTEDLVFLDDQVRLGAPGGMLALTPTADIAWVSLTGEPVLRGWGIAADEMGTIWLVDADAQSLLSVSVDGEVTVVLTDDDGQPFEGLNDVEVGPDGKVYATDPCLGRLIRLDPATGVIDATHDFDLATEGGPNGMAWGQDGRLYVTTENTLILCPSSPVEEFDEPLASIYVLDATEAGFGPHEVVAEGVGTFGDGITFDEEGNLYAIFDTVDGLALGQSAVFVLPGGEGPPEVLVEADDVVYANLAFGHGEFGDTTLYLALLQVPVFTPDTSRGLQRVELGVRGAP